MGDLVTVLQTQTQTLFQAADPAVLTTLLQPHRCCSYSAGQSVAMQHD